MRIEVLFVFVAIFATVGKCYKVLGLFPHPGLSHFHFFHPIMRGLAESGHDVTVVSYFPDKSPPAGYRDLTLKGESILTDSVDLKFFENRRIYNHFIEFFMLHQWGLNACRAALQSEAIATILKQTKRYDVIVMEQFNTDCMMSVAHVLKAPVIALSSSAMMPWHYDRVGNPANPAYIPTLFMGMSEDMSFLSRVGNWISFHALKFLYWYYTEKATNELVRQKFGKNIPDLGELVKETSLFFVNTHYSLSGPKPLSPAVIELGGIHIQKAKPIAEDLQRILDNATHGVIYISWGSMIRAETLPPQKREAILKAVGRFKQTVLWKWENETLPQQPNNVFIKKWMPQREILCHPNVKVFFSHGGLMGSSEAAYCGVPTVLTPMYGDQFLNAAAMENRGMGTLLPYEDITENTVTRAIQKALEPRSMENAKTVAHSYRNRPKNSLGTGIWWVEHVARTKGAHLTKSTSIHLPWYVYNCLDIYLFVASILVLPILSWFWILRALCSRKTSITKTKTN